MSGLVSTLLLILALTRMGYQLTFSALSSMLQKSSLSHFCQAGFAFAFNCNYSTSFIKPLPCALNSQVSGLISSSMRSNVQMDKRLLILLFAILLLPSINANAGSYLVGGNCYSDTNSLLGGFQALYPRYSNGYDFQLYSSGSGSAFGLVNYQEQYRNLNVAAWTLGPAKSIQLPGCTPSMVSTGKLEHFLTLMAVVFLFVFGFNVGKGLFEHRQNGDYA